MKIGIQTWGSHGDIRPFVALAEGLQAAGNDVHHGGAGTTQAVMRAGRPSVVVPNISEQEHWGLELQRPGVAPRPLRRRGATAAALAGRIRAVLADRGPAARARAVADAMRDERGVDTAVALVMQTFAARLGGVKAA